MGAVEMTENLFDKLFKVEWDKFFIPDSSLLEVFLRGSLMYLLMFTLLRIFRRQAGSIGIADLLVIVVIADAAQNGMAGEAKSVTEAVVLVSTIVVWDFFFDFLGYKSKFFERILEPKALPLVKDGKLIRKNMKSEMITRDEIMSQLRQQGIEDINEVKECCLESDGHFSVITKEDKGKQKSNVNKKKIVN
jgi:uncharacterized membrane protein YcaP (DUF421 family)